MITIATDRLINCYSKKFSIKFRKVHNFQQHFHKLTVTQMNMNMVYKIAHFIQFQQQKKAKCS